MRLLAWLVALFLGAPALAQACSCATGAPFSEASARSPLIVRARVLEHGDFLDRRLATSMTVEVQQVLKGEMRGRRMKVWGDPGNLCRPYISKFPVGTQWLLALREDGAISICGVHWLRVE